MMLDGALTADGLSLEGRHDRNWYDHGRGAESRECVRDWLSTSAGT